MTRNHDFLLRMFNINSLIDPHLIQDLDRLEQLDRLAHWYEGFNPLPNLFELAEYQVQQRIEAAALHKFTDSEFEGFRFHWRQLSAGEQRQLLCELAGLPEPHRDHDFED
jgi:hypothetical protein